MAAVLVYNGPVESATDGPWVPINPSDRYLVQQSGYNVTGMNFQLSLDGAEAITLGSSTNPGTVRFVAELGSPSGAWQVSGAPANYIRYHNLGGDVGQVAKTYIQAL